MSTVTDVLVLVAAAVCGAAIGALVSWIDDDGAFGRGALVVLSLVGSGTVLVLWNHLRHPCEPVPGSGTTSASGEPCDVAAATADAIVPILGIGGFVVGLVVGYQIARGRTATS